MERSLWNATIIDHSPLPATIGRILNLKLQQRGHTGRQQALRSVPFPSEVITMKGRPKLTWKWAASRQNQQHSMCAQRRLRSAWAYAQMTGLTIVFAVRSIGSLGPKLSSCRQRRLWSDCADAQADLSLRWARMPFCLFCHEAAQILICGL